jgi:Cu(I)/Ag(I) efflux system membrane fusion protein
MIQQPSLRTFLLALVGGTVALVGLSGTMAGMAGAESGGHATGTQRFDQQMEPILESYLQIGNALSSNSIDGVRERADAIAKHAGTLDSASVSGEHAAKYKDVPTNLKKTAQALGEVKTLGDARESFKKLSQPMALWVTMSKPKNINVFYCSMAKGSWVQKHGKARNPYYGPKMLVCGEVVGGDSYDSRKH